ncbi:hypothetical protein GGI04_004590 [Coemansia thaxteri]|uniref:Uncharacterized protein n=1 Tax=Coemansia thaxteri TaxID=2663907 RepID=A0A9W8BFM6_9FUNG|nr:hypothetical protein GGI04_004590 [Coemansia thaxteri]KAJ2005567.1 hypothetical protein H4R26_001883 [Coemansia thaxteri]KAJ2472051.1 hypothetical protein GGI02_001858 [Coemansia sp. RSA 2322]KAJ2483998.1 hypothetical protein EV174_002788 [Coemansia sp. RSA 2320]
MAERFEDEVHDVARQIYNAVAAQAGEVESSVRRASSLVTELDTHAYGLQAAIEHLSAARRNCTFDIGIRAPLPPSEFASAAPEAPRLAECLDAVGSRLAETNKAAARRIAWVPESASRE